MAAPLDKKTLLCKFLERGMAMIHLDARASGVRVPRHLEQDPHVALNLSWRFPSAVMVVDDAGVQATLHFSGTPFTVVAPWSAIFAVYSHASGEGFAWPEDVPADVALLSPPRSRAKPQLAAVSTEVIVEEVAPRPPPARGHLRLVK